MQEINNEQIDILDKDFEKVKAIAKEMKELEEKYKGSDELETFLKYTNQCE